MSVLLNSSPVVSPRYIQQWTFLCLLSLVWLGMTSAGCVVGDVGVGVPGCESCPDRCLDSKNGWGRCVACLKDEQCQSSVSPTKRCSQDNRCICGSDKDCPADRYCIGEGGCVECKVDKDCKDPKHTACVGNKCQECRRGEIRSCGPSDQTACKKGTQSCLGSGLWGDCQNWLVCKSGERCENETCVPDCPAATCKVGEQRCESGATDRYQRCIRDAKGCLGWGAAQACPTGQACTAGKCELPACPTGQTRCGDTCIDLQKDPKHCGTCDNACKSAEGCDAGTCVSQCQAPKVNCAGAGVPPVCADLQTDADHCGVCNYACKSDEICDAGKCKPKCPSGQSDCSGQCVDLQTDHKHCGKCGNACPSGEQCSGGVCAKNCTGGTSLCGTTCVDLQTDTKHCGACNKPCHQGETCQSGQCTCPSGQTSCSGACVDLTSDTKHCGACNTACKQGEVCQSSTCQLTCPTGQTVCGGTCVDLKTDTKHCGACNNACASSQTCAQGACQAPCPGGQMQCSGGCVDTTANDYHCGGCNKRCPANQNCQAGVCKSCTGSTVTEICANNKDDDCDGQIDELSECGATPVSGGIFDYAVRSSGEIFVVHSTSSSAGIQGTCYRTGGTILAAKFTIDPQATYTQEFPSVHTAPGSDRFVVAWIQRSAKDYSTRNLHFRLYDSQCKPVGTRFSWPYPDGKGEYTYSVSMDGSGDFAALFRDDQRNLRLVFFDKAGKKLTDLLVDPATNSRCSGSGYGLQMSMNQTGAGLVSCQKHSSNPIYYRRFSAQRTFLDAALVQFKDSVSNSSWYESHTSGINNKGEFVIEWQAYSSGDNRATFFNSQGQLAKAATTISTRVGNGFDGFRYVHQQVQLLGDDFILRDTLRSSSDNPIWYRYSSTGTLLSTARGAYQPWSLRSNGKTAYVVDGNSIKILDLSPGKGICKGQACVCTPQATQKCYHGSTSLSVRGACQTGIETCQADGLGWGACVGEVLPSPEACSNQVDDDCDGQVDENCTNPQGIDTPGISDFDVSSNGTIAAIFWTGNALLGYCINPNGTVKQKSFLIESNTASISNPLVKMSRNAQYIAVMWRGSVGSSTRLRDVVFRLYDANCKPITQSIVLQKDQGGEWYDVAIDDNGRFTFVYYNDKNELWMKRYSSTGAVLGSALQLDAGQRCDYGVHVGVSATTGNGVFTCQGHSSDPVYFRRFSATGQLLGTDLTEVQGTKGNSSWYASHILGVNNNGEFVVEWQSSSKQLFYANFYNASGAFVKTVTVGGGMKSTYDAFRYAHPGVVLYGNDFVLRDGGQRGTTVNWYRYNAKGTQVSKATMPTTGSYRRESLRLDSTKTYIIDGKVIQVGNIIFQ